MVATILLPEVRLASPSTAGAGDGRVWLGPNAVRELGVTLGDPIVVDVRVGGGGPSGEASNSATDVWPWSFLVTAAPTPVQRDNAVVGAVSAADEAVILDPTTMVVLDDSGDGVSSRFPKHKTRLEGRALALRDKNGENVKPVGCTSVTLYAPHLTDTAGHCNEATRKLLHNRLVTNGCSICFDTIDATTSKRIFVSQVYPSNVPVLRIGPGTTIVFTSELPPDEDVQKDSINKTKDTKQNIKAHTKIAGAKEVLARLREAILWPVLYADDAINLGVTFPTGVLLHGPPGVGKTASVVAVCQEAGASLKTLSAGDVFGPYAGDAEAKLRKTFREAQKICKKENMPCVILLDEIDAMCPRRGGDSGLSNSRVVAQLLTLMDDGGGEGGREGKQLSETSKTKKHTLKPVIVGTTNRPNSLDPALRRPGRFDLEVEIDLPGKVQREAILAVQAVGLPLGKDVSLSDVAENAKGYSGADLAALCREAAMAAIRETSAIEETAETAEMRVTASHFSSAAKKVGASVTRGASVELPPTTWDDVGGLQNVKRRLMQAVEWPLKHSKSFDRLGLAPPRGVLLHGPPGCAKTTLARAAAHASGATVIQLSAADVFSKYVGEGERLLRDAFAKARRAAPAVLLLDEIDGMVGNRGGVGEGDINEGNSVAARVLSAFLVEMDGLEVSSGEKNDDLETSSFTTESNVLVIATTNRPQNLDHALMRPGRLDLCLYVPPPDCVGREEALKVHAKGVPLANDVDFKKCAERTERFTGAELRSVIREAALLALRENMGAVEVTARNIDQALHAAKPALSERDLAKWASFRA